MVFEPKAATTIDPAAVGSGLADTAGVISVSGMPMVDSAGVTRYVVGRIVTIAGPATYATGGIPVDLSANFSRIVGFGFCRQFNTATPSTVTSQGGTIMSPVENGTDLLASGKFRLLLMRYTATGSVAAPTFTGSSATTSTPAAGAPCIATCNQNHPNLSALTVTATGSNSAPAFTGNALGHTEVGNGSSFSNGNTYEILVYGVPV